MAHWLLGPARVIGWVALGFGAAVGYKLGSHLVGVVTGEEELFKRSEETGPYPEQPLWKRRFSRVSEPDG